MKKSLFLFIVPVAILSLALVGFNPAITQAQTSTSVQCPVGYTCTPVAPQPVNCPAGYICTPTAPVPSPIPVPQPIPVSPMPVYSTCYVFSTNLQIGSTGADVVALQTWLIGNGFNIPDISSSKSTKGYFGQSTYLALIRYQTSVGLPATGFFGPLTRAKVNASCGPINPPQPVTRLVDLLVVSTYSNGNQTAGIRASIKGDIGNKNISKWTLDISCTPGITMQVPVMKELCNTQQTYYANNYYDVTQDIVLLTVDASNTGTTPNNPSVRFILTGYDTNNSSFGSDKEIVPLGFTSTQPSIIVLSPKSSEVYDRGSQLNVQWTGYLGDFDYYQLMLGNTIANSEVQIDDGRQISKYQNSYSTFAVWTFVDKIVGASGMNSDSIKNAYYVKVNAVKSDRVSGGIMNTGKSGIFTITSGTTTPPSIPFVQILSPNGGETYKNDGSPITVNWYTSNVLSSQRLDVIRLRAYLGGQEYNLASNVLNDGQEVITIPSSIPVGAYTLEIKTYVNGTLVMDSSDSYFKIVSVSTPQPSITVLSPNGVENFQTGGAIDIKWNSTGIPIDTTKADAIKIVVRYKHNDLTYSGGQIFEDWIVEKTANIGSYRWVIPEYYSRGVDASSFYVRVLLNSDTSVSDTSDRPFTITTGPTSSSMLTVTSPSAGSSYAPGGSIQINWTPKLPTSSFGLSLLKASDPSFLRLFFPTVSNAGVNSWIIPSSLPSGSDYYVRVNEGVYRERTGYSGNFTITAPTPQTERQIQNTSSDLTSAIWDAIKEYYKSGGQ